ncbi:MAG TPA: hypothetical protein VIG99_22420 [Myxococcaceae bacterium]
MKTNAGTSTSFKSSTPPSGPVEARKTSQEPAEKEKSRAPAAPGSADTFEAPAAGTRDARRTAAARDQNDGMDGVTDSDRNVMLRMNTSEATEIRPNFYQGPGPGVPVPREGTHVGMTEDAGTAAGLNQNFTNWTADSNANVDAREYDNDAAHSYNSSREGALKRAGDLGRRLDAATTRYQAATTDSERQAAAREMATAYGQYLHMLQDNRAHGGTDRAEHYGDHVDEKPESMEQGRADTKAAMANFTAYLRSRGIDPATVDPGGPRPSYKYPPVSGAGDKLFAPHWDGQTRMWNRDDMARDLHTAFNSGIKGTPTDVQ